MKAPYLEHNGNTVRLIVDGAPYIILGGELHNSTSSDSPPRDEVWKKAKDCNMNTVLAVVSWELVEPEEDVFDFTMVDVLLEQARKHGLRLVLLWFGTWKNGLSTYVPGWVKTDTARFVRARDSGGRQMRTISCLCGNTMQADAKAYAALMRHIRQADAGRYTVIAMQVQNECGLLGSPRDYGFAAGAAFGAPVPGELVSHLADCALPGQYSLGKAPQVSQAGGKEDWRAAFGPQAAEAFMVWHTARYVQAVAEAGKREYDIPYFVNAWPVQYRNEPAGHYPSGGPVAHMHAIWRFAAPSIDILGVDLYLESFAQDCADYTQLPGNPLFISETRRDKWGPAFLFYALGQHNTLCVSPFGIDSLGCVVKKPNLSGVQNVFTYMDEKDISGMMVDTYRVLGELVPLLSQVAGQNRSCGVLQGWIRNEAVSLGGCLLDFRFADKVEQAEYPAGGLAVAAGDNEFIIAGFGFSVSFLPLPGEEARQLDFDYIDEVNYESGQWVSSRRRNGDELSVQFAERPGIMRVKLYGM